MRIAIIQLLEGTCADIVSSCLRALVRIASVQLLEGTCADIVYPVACELLCG